MKAVNEILEHDVMLS